MAKPDFLTVSDFRKSNLKNWGCFPKIVQQCKQLGWVKLAHIAIEGMKIRINASEALLRYVSRKRLNKVWNTLMPLIFRETLSAFRIKQVMSFRKIFVI
jgi:hypothetical protein